MNDLIQTKKELLRQLLVARLGKSFIMENHSTVTEACQKFLEDQEKLRMCAQHNMSGSGDELLLASMERMAAVRQRLCA
ncbi:hypothetical protein ASG93_30535 [Paenibacillus sp. Soil787]|nr:hypothetical protein ASG93_30535 [Paenibacillus sp. Soil787]